MATVKPKARQLLPFGRSSQVTKFGSERLPASKLPPVHIRELVMIAPLGRCHLFSSTPDQEQADASLKPVFGQTFIEMLQQGWLAVGNNSVYLPVVTIGKNHDMGWQQLDAFRTVLARYESYLATVIVRAYSFADGGYENVGRFRTLKGAEQGVRGG